MKIFMNRKQPNQSEIDQYDNAEPNIIAKFDDKISYTNKVICIGNICVELSELLCIGINTTDQGPFFDDMALLLSLSRNIIVIPSMHPAFFDTITQLNKDFPIDYQKVIDASSCAVNKQFVLWSRK
ncbi:MAG: hypothetical protein FWE80_04430 [Oscillospiraceae bacterium]|nr:hypothetical protein [Oscillospiraceae bacterium]